MSRHTPGRKVGVAQERAGIRGFLESYCHRAGVFKSKEKGLGDRTPLERPEMGGIAENETPY